MLTMPNLAYFYRLCLPNCGSPTVAFCLCWNGAQSISGTQTQLLGFYRARHLDKAVLQSGRELFKD